MAMPRIVGAERLDRLAVDEPAPAWPPVDLTLLDAQPLVERATIESYAELGWNVLPSVLDVLDWAAEWTG